MHVISVAHKNVLQLLWRDVSNGGQEPPIVEPVDPFKRCQLNSVPVFPWPLPIDQFGFVKSVNGLREGIIIGIPNTADRSDKARFSQSLRIANGHILTAAVGMVGHFSLWPPLAQSLLKGIQHEVGMGR